MKMTSSTPNGYFSAQVNVPVTVTKATLVEPDRHQVSVMMWVVSDEEKRTYEYRIDDDGWTLVVTHDFPKIFHSKEKCFPKKRLGKYYKIWQGAYIDCLAEFMEENGLDDMENLTYEQRIPLPIQVLSNKEHDTVEYINLKKLVVRNIMLRGTRVFGNGAETEVKEMEYFEDSESNDDEGDSDDDSSSDDDESVSSF